MRLSSSPDQLERHSTSDGRGLFCEIDDAHSALTEGVDDDVGADLLGLKGQISNARAVPLRSYRYPSGGVLKRGINQTDRAHRSVPRRYERRPAP